MRITVLGSGSPEAYAARASSGYLIETGGSKILFDCGGGSFDSLLRAGHLPSQITHLVFSHLHSDHMMDYARLIHAAWDEGGAPIAVYGPPPIAAITEKLFGTDGVFAHDLKARTEFKPSQDVWVARGGALPRPWPAPMVAEIAPGFALTGNGWKLATCEVPHAQPHLMCLAIAIEAGGRKLTYSGDAGRSEKLIALANGSDLLIHWCYRLDAEAAHPQMAALTPTPSQIGAIAREAGARRLLLTHFRKHMDEGDGPARAVSEARGNFGGPVEVAQDGQVIDL